MTIVTFPHFCGECQKTFDDFAYSKEPLPNGSGIEITRRCPFCNAEIPAEFTQI